MEMVNFPYISKETLSKLSNFSFNSGPPSDYEKYFRSLQGFQIWQQGWKTAQSTQLKEVNYFLEKTLWGTFVYRATVEPEIWSCRILQFSEENPDKKAGTWNRYNSIQIFFFFPLKNKGNRLSKCCYGDFPLKIKIQK